MRCCRSSVPALAEGWVALYNRRTPQASWEGLIFKERGSKKPVIGFYDEPQLLWTHCSTIPGFSQPHVSSSGPGNPLQPKEGVEIRHSSPDRVLPVVFVGFTHTTHVVWTHTIHIHHRASADAGPKAFLRRCCLLHRSSPRLPLSAAGWRSAAEASSGQTLPGRSVLRGPGSRWQWNWFYFSLKKQNTCVSFQDLTPRVPGYRRSRRNRTETVGDVTGGSSTGSERRDSAQEPQNQTAVGAVSRFNRQSHQPLCSFCSAQEPSPAGSRSRRRRGAPVASRLG